MMNELFDTTFTIDDIISTNIIEDRFAEYCNLLDTLDEIVSYDVITEEVNDTMPTFSNSAKRIKDNTIDTTNSTFKAFGNIIDGKSKLIKSTWDLVIRCISLITRLIGFIFSKLGEIPRLILKAANGIMNIPKNIRDKIKGNIHLYITIDDIDNIYNQTLMNRLDSFISLAASLAQGELWGTMFKKSEKVLGRKIYANQNDIKAAKQLESLYDRLRYIEFTKSTIEMQDENARNAYFGDGIVKFNDLKGNKFSGSYYEALKKIFDDITSRKNEIEIIRNAIGEKYSATQLNQTFVKLNRFDQQRIVSTIRMISKSISIIGNMTRYVIIDMKTIEKTKEKIFKAMNKKNNKE